MKIQVLSVEEKRHGARLGFWFADEQGRTGWCLPSLRFMQENPSFSVKPGDRLVAADFIPDSITGQIIPILVPESLQKIASASN
jgi:hypothetical protein